MSDFVTWECQKKVSKRQKSKIPVIRGQMMPTYDEEERFWHDWERLTSEQRHAFLAAVYKMIADIRSGQGFRKGLRIKGVQGNPLIFEMTWASDGRATFMYGTPKVDGDIHIIRRRIGTRAILKNL